jgi:hypothetical protein
VPDAKFIGLKVLVNLGGEEAWTATPVEKRGRSDDLNLGEKEREEDLIENGHKDNSRGTYTNLVMVPYSDRERYMRVAPMVL